MLERDALLAKGNARKAVGRVDPCVALDHVHVRTNIHSNDLAPRLERLRIERGVSPGIDGAGTREKPRSKGKNLQGQWGRSWRSTSTYRSGPKSSICRKRAKP